MPDHEHYNSTLYNGAIPKFVTGAQKPTFEFNWINKASLQHQPPEIEFNDTKPAAASLSHDHGQDSSDNESMSNSSTGSDETLQDHEATAFDDKFKELLPHTVGQKMDHELVTLLDSMNCPGKAFEKVMEWSRRAHKLGYNFKPSIKTRKQLIAKYYKDFNLEHMQPYTAVVKIETRSEHLDDSVELTLFDFANQLKSLLSDPELMQPENLNINEEDFRLPYKGSANVGELMTAWWYKATCALMRKSDKDWVVPIIFYTDKTHIDFKSKFVIKPVV